MPRTDDATAASMGRREMRPARWLREPLLVAGVVFVIGLALFSWLYDPYVPAGPDLLGDGRFDKGPPDPDAMPEGAAELRVVGDVGWAPGEGVGGSGAVRLTAGGKMASLRWTVRDPRRHAFLRFSGAVRTRGVVPGDRPWQMARVLLFYADGKGRGIWGRPHVSQLYRGDHPWTRFSGTVRVPAEAASARAFVQIVARAGTMWADELQLVPMTERRFYAPLRILLISAFVGLTVGVVRRVRLWRRRFGKAATAVAALILLGVLLPGPAVQVGLEQAFGAAGRGIRVLLSLGTEAAPPAGATAPEQTRRPAKSPPGNNGSFDLEALFTRTGVLRAKKSGHVLLFALLGLFAQLAWLRSRPDRSPATVRLESWLPVGLALLLYATGSEMLQVLTETRLAQVSDFLLDVAGLAAGIAVAWIALRLRRPPSDAPP